MAHIGFLSERMRLGFGVDLTTHKIAQGLVEKGHKVTVYCSFDDGTYHGNNYKIKEFKTPTKELSYKYEYQAIRAANQLKNEPIDLYVPQTFPFFSIPIWIRKPYIAFDYGVVGTHGMPFKMKLFMHYMRTTQSYAYHNFAKRVVTISNYLKSTFPLTVRWKTDVVHLGADHYEQNVDKNKTIKFRKDMGVAEDDILLLYIGRLDKVPYKDVEELVNIFQNISINQPRVKMVLAGFGAQVDELRLKFRGTIPLRHVPVEEMPLLLSACDIYTTASKWEGFNLPLVEAQYFGKPVVAYKLCAHPEVVGEGGFLINSKEEFTEKLLLLINNPETRENMGRKAKAWANNFTWDKTVEAFDEILQRVIK